MFFLISNVIFVLCGSFFVECIHEVSPKEEIHLYAPSIYISKAFADDLEANFTPLQCVEN